MLLHRTPWSPVQQHLRHNGHDDTRANHKNKTTRKQNEMSATAHFSSCCHMTQLTCTFFFAVANEHTSAHAAHP